MTVFHFERGWKYTPCKLGGGVVHYVHPNSRERMKVALERGCRCHHDGEYTASLTLRNNAAWLQCDACGSSVGAAMKREEHPSHMQYPHWRMNLVTAYEAAQEAWRAEQPSWEEKTEQDKRARERAYIERSVAYERWCRTSPEWKALKERIIWRSRGHCEACLSGNADVVHHLTYDFGVLPPAWHLKAVCFGCHERLHSGGDEWCDFGMARGG